MLPDGRDRHGRSVELDDREQFLPGKIFDHRSAIFAVDEKLDRPVAGRKPDSDPIPDLQPIQRVAVIASDDFSGSFFVVSFDVAALDPDRLLPESNQSGGQSGFRDRARVSGGQPESY